MSIDFEFTAYTNRIYIEGGRCTKLFSQGYKRSDVLTEAAITSRAADAGLSVPNITAINVRDGQWAIEFEAAKGIGLDRIMAEQPERKEEWLTLLAEIQLAISKVSIPRLDPIHDKMNRKIQQTELPATVRYGLYYELNDIPKKQSVVHGDLNPSSVIVDEDGNYTIANWAHASTGDSCADVAMTMLSFEYGMDRETADRYLEIFCEKSGCAPEDVTRWVPIVAAAGSLNADPKTREFLLSKI